MFAIIGMQRGNQFLSPTSTYDIALFIYTLGALEVWPATLHDWHPTAEHQGQTLPKKVTEQVDCTWRQQTAHMSQVGKQSFLEFCVEIS